MRISTEVKDNFEIKTKYFSQSKKIAYFDEILFNNRCEYRQYFAHGGKNHTIFVIDIQFMDNSLLHVEFSENKHLMLSMTDY